MDYFPSLNVCLDFKGTTLILSMNQGFKNDSKSRLEERFGRFVTGDFEVIEAEADLGEVALIGLLLVKLRHQSANTQSSIDGETSLRGLLASIRGCAKLTPERS